MKLTKQQAVTSYNLELTVDEAMMLRAIVGNIGVRNAGAIGDFTMALYDKLYVALPEVKDCFPYEQKNVSFKPDHGETVAQYLEQVKE